MPSIAELKRENARLLREDVRERREVFRGMPDFVALHTIDYCNLRCVMCPRSVDPGGGKLDRGSLTRVCDELFPTARRAIVTGHQGEPMLGDFDVIENAALRHEVKLEIVTNGTMIGGAWYRRVRSALGLLNVSIDTHDPETYERIRVGSRFDRIHEKLRAIQEERAREPDDVVWTLSAVVMRSNLAQLPEFVEFAASLGVDAVIFQPLRQFERSIPEEDVVGGGAHDRHAGVASGCPAPLARAGDGRAALLAQFDRSCDVARRTGINLYFSDFQLPSVEPRPLGGRIAGMTEPTEFCRSLIHSLSVFDTGDVYPCCHPTDHVVGNVDRESVSAIWNGRAMRRLRRAHFERTGTMFCTGCIHAPYLGERSASRIVNGVKSTRLAVQHYRSLWTRGARRALHRICGRGGREVATEVDGAAAPAVRSELRGF